MTGIASDGGKSSRYHPSKRAVGVLALALMMVTAGCAGVLGNDDKEKPPLEEIPEGVDGVVHMKSGILEDPTTEELMNGVIDMAANNTAGQEDAPDSWDEVLQEVDNESELDPEKFHSATMFVRTANVTEAEDALDPENQYAGVIVQSDYTWSELRQTTENQTETEFEEQSYSGVTVYVAQSDLDRGMWVADMGNGKFVFGPEQAVKDVIDTSEGDSEAFSGQLREAYDSTTDGYITAAFTVSDAQQDAIGDAAAEEAGFGAMLVPDAQVVTMSYHTEDDQMTLETRLSMGSTEEAEQFHSLLEPVLEPETVSEDPDPGESPIEWATASTTLEQDEEHVSITVAVTPDELLTLLEATNPGSVGGLPAPSMEIAG